MKPIKKQTFGTASTNQAAAAGVAIVRAQGKPGISQGTPIDPRWAWHYGVLIELRTRLLKDRGDQMTAAAEPIKAFSMHMADAATDHYDQALALSQLSLEQDALFEVDEAIHRILDGSYGFCQETGAPIPAARLKAIPWTRFGTEVENRLERENLVSRAHLGRLGSVQVDTVDHPAARPSQVEAHQAMLGNTEDPKRKTMLQEESSETSKSEGHSP